MYETKRVVVPVSIFGMVFLYDDSCTNLPVCRRRGGWVGATQQTKLYGDTM